MNNLKVIEKLFKEVVAFLKYVHGLPKGSLGCKTFVLKRSYVTVIDQIYYLKLKILKKILSTNEKQDYNAG